MRKFDCERYFEQIKTMPEPIMTSELPKVKLNLKGIREYAESKGSAIASLTEGEKQFFITRQMGNFTDNLRII